MSKNIFLNYYDLGNLSYNDHIILKFMLYDLKNFIKNKTENFKQQPNQIQSSIKEFANLL